MTSDATEASTPPGAGAKAEPETPPAAEPATTAVTEALIELRGIPGQQQYRAIITWGKLMAASGYFEDAKNYAQAAVKILYGVEMGYSVAAAMAGVHIIEGKPSLAAHLQAAKVRESGKYDYVIKRLDDEACVLEFRRRGPTGQWEVLGESEFTTAHAERARLFGRRAQNWEKYPRAMLYARAMSAGIKWHCPDVFSSGPVYTPEELVPDHEVTSDGDLIEAVIVPPGPSLDDPATAAAVVERRPAQRQPRDAAQPAPQRTRQQRGQPEQIDEIEDVGGLLWWARDLLGKYDRANGTRDILAYYAVEGPADIRVKFEGDLRAAARFLREQVVGEPEPPPPAGPDDLSPEQRVIYDDVIAAGSNHEDAMLLARDQGDDVEEEAGDDDDGDEAVQADGTTAPPSAPPEAGGTGPEGAVADPAP